MTDAVTQVAQDLSEISRLAGHLSDQAGHERPGGPATVMLGPSANLEAWQHLIDAAERRHDETCPHGTHEHCDVAPHVADEDPEWEPPLQTLCFWSEDWRREHGRESDRRPTIATEVDFLRRVLEWAAANEAHFGDFAADVRKARRRLESELHDELRAALGVVPCRECGSDLVRVHDDRQLRSRGCLGHGYLRICPLPAHSDGSADTGGYRDEWRCVNPGCGETYGIGRYSSMVARDFRENAAALCGADLEKRTGVKWSTIRQWAARGKVRKRGRDHFGRQLYDVTDAGREAELQSCATLSQTTG